MLNYPSLILSFSRRYRCIGTTQSLRQSRGRATPTRLDNAGQGNADHFTRQRRIDWRLRAGSFNEFRATLSGSSAESGTLHSEVFFAPPSFDLSARDGRPLAVFFEQLRCLECDTFHQKVLVQPIVRS